MFVNMAEPMKVWLVDNAKSSFLKEILTALSCFQTYSALKLFDCVLAS